MDCKWIFFGLLFSFALASQAVGNEEGSTTSPLVVMVCEHGSVKSLIAAELFDREAKDRGLPFRALSRGLHPDEAVPEKVASALSKDGFDILEFDPKKLEEREVRDALRVVSIGTDLSEFQGQASLPILEWKNVPPASVDYEASKASLLVHIQRLLDELQKQQQ